MQLRDVRPSVHTSATGELIAAFDDQTRHIVLLRQFANKGPDFLLHGVQDLLGRSLPVCADDFSESLQAKLLAGNIGPFEKSIGNGNQQVSPFEAPIDGLLQHLVLHHAQR